MTGSADAVPRASRGAGSGRFPAVAERLLRIAVSGWCTVAVIGQLLFAAYVAGFFGRVALSGDLAGWNEVLPHGHVAGDTAGNLVVGLHLLFAIVIILGGAVQLMPVVRRRAPALHRWNGRLYLFAAMVMSVGGLVMVWTRGTVGDLSQHISISINAVLILACAGMALRFALARRIDRHRRWALRLFLVVSGVWFFRVGLMFWVLVHRGPVGFDPATFTGPFLTALAFSQYLVPLAVLELYFLAQRSRASAVRVAMAALLALLTLVTATGIAAAVMVMWLPRL